MKQGSHQAVFLNSEGITALGHLAPTWLQDGSLLCRRITTHNYFVEIVARARSLPDEEDADAHLLIPTHFVNLIVLDEPNPRPGFTG